ncbi:DNA-3-methyladenine glycosylase family protein [Paraburkholderia silvatlantica]|uniref:DNA-3-methyladenine glycosylase II n=1 Tax=Paraburkholderia silvatlantica TaxID=321895 RepID=A0A2U1AHG3_9BURK|nr:DNA-3-methyladenine glycosylase [Paraburkholderia silvatlantica]MBB2929489.1 DNA-3-methyladenine glycosylase II [Paraburkholderia silvatlantica]PVY35820.1 DNA-3-methyladenine glycosylase II [Paraburkholderia silvatlantica]PXW39768.1 DNA-3-methyladenine glycosylase II [Paraburkholderia silvatlantica]PYE21981.1 DNA-3-methyladenine glycosylase II [Paraburkholderia silvatlantica]TDQ99390.1 DNA-3-methyladenine glycosylase II [Paraburkholderia silvatlantica]
MATATKTQTRRSASLTGGTAGAPAGAKRALNGAGGKAAAKPAAKTARGKTNGASGSHEVLDGAAIEAALSNGPAVLEAVEPAANALGDLEFEVQRPDYWDKACADLVKRDRILKKLIPKFGPVHLLSRDDPFVTLARSVVGQQISTAAAQALWQRVEAACPKLVPQQFLKLGHEKLAACGLSKRKTEYILDLAQHFVSGALHVGKWTSMDDEDVIAELTAIRGIGRWTAEMFLIFNLARPNVLPLDDLGLIRAISVNYFSGEPVTRSEAREVAANWEPWRTVATWYMWRSLEPS